jgi:putative nucleotidyltransferase with HDIG domain
MKSVPRILACDDDPLIRGFLEQALKIGGHEVVSAADGSEAISLLVTGHTFDAVITDYNMPRANGIDVINHIRGFDPTLPCIIVTAFRDLDLAMRAMHAGAVGFVPKPFKSDHLLTVIRHACERRALEEEAMQARVIMPMLERFTMVLANTLETKDVSTHMHSQRLVHLADQVAESLGLSRRERGPLRLGACLHDIGKIGVPEEILQKPHPLTTEEFELIKEHPLIGARILEQIDSWNEVTTVVRHHHEHYDGSGYPDGLKGDKIPIGARIVGVVDAFDVMVAGRSYSRPKPVDQVLAEISSLRAKQFDPDVVEALLACGEHLITTDTGAHGAVQKSDNVVASWLLSHVELV